MKNFLTFLLCVLTAGLTGCAVEYTHTNNNESKTRKLSIGKVEHDSRTRLTPDTH